jgi:hypothetical protein
MISFGFEDGFADSFDEGFEAGTAFSGLSDTIGRMKTFLAGAGAGAGTRGTATEAGVAVAMETFGIVGIAETAGAGTGVALGIEAFSSCARLNKNSR